MEAFRNPSFRTLFASALLFFTAMGAYLALGIHANTFFRSEEHTSELQSLMRISYAVFCLKKKNKPYIYVIIYTQSIDLINRTLIKQHQLTLLNQTIATIT